MIVFTGRRRAMDKRGNVLIVLGICILISLLSSCTPTGPCYIQPNTPLTAYRLPDPTSDVFGSFPPVDTYRALARTADGWVGFDPGIAQAGNIGLAHHRWVQFNAYVSSSCLDSVDLVTLADVMVDMAASGH
jgi:hypothetical protein